MSEEDKILKKMDKFYKKTPTNELKKINDEINKTISSEGVTFEDYLKSLQPCPSVTILKCDDWHVLYINGMKVREKHSLDISDLAEYINIKQISLELSDKEKDKFSDFPNREEDISNFLNKTYESI
jgi:hypothetical protein